MWIAILYQFLKHKWLINDLSNIGMSLSTWLLIYVDHQTKYQSSSTLYIAYIIITSILLISSIASFIIANYRNKKDKHS